jgi:hypothetical protein
VPDAVTQLYLYGGISNFRGPRSNYTDVNVLDLQSFLSIHRYENKSMCMWVWVWVWVLSHSLYLCTLRGVRRRDSSLDSLPLSIPQHPPVARACLMHVSSLSDSREGAPAWAPLGGKSKPSEGRVAEAEAEDAKRESESAEAAMKIAAVEEVSVSALPGV